jgi:hypothetical protein
MTFAIPILLFRQAGRTRDGVHHREENPPAGPQEFSWFAQKGSSRPPLVRVAGHIRKPVSGRKHQTGRIGRKSTELDTSETSACLDRDGDCASFPAGKGATAMAIRSTFRILAALAALLAGISSANADRRVALVIGIGAYKNLSSLDNPVSDAKAIAASLRGRGFEVHEYYDALRGDLLNALEDFQAATSGADVALVYYAGHGMELAGENVLAPIDTEVTCEPRQARRTVKIGELFDALGQAKNQVVLLDACRNDPFPQCASRGTLSGGGFRGLQRVAASDTSLIIANSTLSGQLAADGEPGAHSPFATALLSRFDADGSAPLRDMLDRTARDVRDATGGTQVPEISTQGGAPDICLNANCSQAVASNQSSATTTTEQSTTTRAAEDKEAYEAAIAVGSCGALQAFVGAYPSSFYASLARERAIEACAPRPQEQASVQPQTQTQAGSDYEGEFIFPDSSGRRLTRDDLAPLSVEQLRIARNEIYARNGRFFRDQNLKDYFSQYSWYQPNSWDPPLNATEKYNVRVIQQEEKRR